MQQLTSHFEVKDVGAMPTTVYTNRDYASTPVWDFMQKYHWMPS